MRRQRGLPGALEELAGRHGALTVRPADVELRVQRERYGWVLRSGICVGDRAAHRSPVADLEVPDQRGGGRQQRNIAVDHLARFERALADHRTEYDMTVHALDKAQRGDAADVDQSIDAPDGG